MTPQLKKWIIRPLLIALATAIVLLGVAWAILMLEHQRLVEFATDEINKKYKGELTVGASEISFFKHFPSIGFTVHNVNFYADETKAGSPILSFERLSVGVRPWGLISKDHHVRRLSFHGGKVEIRRGTDGNVNLLDALNIHPDTTQRSDTDDKTVLIDLQKIALKETTISFIDEINNTAVTTTISELASTFTSDTSQMTMTLKSDLELTITSKEDTTFIRNKKLNLDITADYKVHQKLLELTQGKIKLQDASFDLAGTADLSKGCDLDLKIKGEEPDFKMLAAFLPGDIKSLLKPFSYDGHVYFDGVVKGNISHDETPHVEVTFGCKDAWFLNDGVNKKVDQLGFRGFYTNGSERSLRTSEIQIMDMNARPGKGIFKANFMVRDFTQPRILMQILSELELSFLGDFLGIKDLHQVAGKIKLEMDFKEIVNLDTAEQSLTKLKEGIQSKLTVSNLSFKIPGYPHEIRNVNLHAEMNKGRVNLDSISVRIGGSDLRMTGSISDIQGFLRNPHEPIVLSLNARGDQILLHELFSYDTALARTMNEEIHKFNVGMNLQTSVAELLHPKPLPQGKFEIKNLRGTFKNYAHTFKDLSATIKIADTILTVSDFTGAIDSSDINLNGRISNYGLWMKDLKKGRTEVSFDFKSNKFALRDVFSRNIRRYLPRGYRREELNNATLQAKINFRYDTSFRFMRAEVSNITAFMKRHKIQLKDINGKVKYGASKLFALDTLKGFIGKSDFDLTVRLINTENKALKKRTNYFHFKSASLDVDEITSYDFSVPPPRRRGDSTTAVRVDTSAHAKAFNIFVLPFSDFGVWVDIGKFKYNKLWIKDLTARMRLTEDHKIHLDTIGMKIAKGTVGIKGLLNGGDTAKILFNSVIKVDQLDLEKVMVKLDNFGHDIVINKHIKGKISGVITSDFQVHPNLVPLMQTTTAQLQVRIYDGSLVDFAPMLAMAGYFKDKNLRLVRFDSLKNELTFSNGTLTIPAMDINSSLGAIQMSGKQSLDLHMEYYMRIPMKMVTQVGMSSLFDKKTAIDSAQIDQVVYANKERKGLFVNLKVAGTPDDFKVSLGRKKG